MDGAVAVIFLAFFFIAAAFAVSSSSCSSASLSASVAASTADYPSSYSSASTAAFLAALVLDDTMSSGVSRSEAVSLIIFETPSPAELSPAERVSLRLAIYLSSSS